MRKRAGLAGLGALMIAIAIYFFPLGQDIVILTLTEMTGSQVNAWIALYGICFSLIFVGFLLGGGNALHLGKATRTLMTFISNPVRLMAVLVAGFAFYLVYTGGLPL